MNYARIYAEFIADRLAKQPEKPAYFEVHHIKPRSLGGGNEPENLIRLTPEDHYFAHLLLAKAHGGSLWYGLVAMTVNSSGRKFSEGYLRRARKIVSVARKNAAIVHSENMKGRFVGELHPMWGRPCPELAKQKTRERFAAGFSPMDSPEARRKVSEALKGRKLSDETLRKISEAKIGVKRSESSRIKQSKTMTGRKRSVESIEKTRAALLGKKKSEAHVQKMREVNLGKALSEETKRKISDRWKEQGHPKGMLGKSHSAETKERYKALNAAKRLYADMFSVSPRSVTIAMMEAAGIYVGQKSRQ